MIDILLATYNGEKYIEEQIESLLCQTYKSWHLIVGDDCSNDRTVDILRKYKNLYPDKIEIHVNKVPSGGAKHNFYNLMTRARSNYIMFCDQDDVWVEDKIEVTLNKMMSAEEKYGNDMPLLVHSDLCVVDKNLNVINPSMFEMQGMDYRKDKLNHLLVSNIVTGCTMMINRSLLELAYVKPRFFVMHDMWLALLASAFGKIMFINKPLILYRQHGSNSIGAKNIHSLNYIICKLESINLVRENLNIQYKQASELLSMYESINPIYRDMLFKYSNFGEYSWVKRFVTLRRYKMFKDGLIRKVGQIVL